MMDLTLFVSGMVLGISVAAPIGPIGILCIHRALRGGFWHGFATGMGAAVADMIYALVASFGMELAAGMLASFALPLRIAGILFLFYLGIKTFMREAGAKKEVAEKGGSIFRDFLSSFALMISNPMTILFFLAVFSSLGLVGYSRGGFGALVFVAGVFSGSALWWALLCGLSEAFREKLRWHLGTINRLAGLLLCAFGALLLFSAIFP
jgi:threonine/homoserine/homoserine lactone efflux protein